jgi:alpha-N-arabinofuranosidase
LAPGCRGEGTQRSHYSVLVDVSKTQEPVSKYIYGQFIEHLGRCIYGGIWAEMLEDRKFFYELTGDPQPWELITPGPSSWEGSGIPYEVLTKSPWLMTGESGTVRMSRRDRFVGEHTPEVVLPGYGKPYGIYQGRLGLIKGAKYSGRVVLAGDPEAAPIEISLIWGEGPAHRQTFTVERLTADFRKVEFVLTAGAASDDGYLEIVGRGRGVFRIGAASLMPADNLQGFRKDTLELMKELNAPIYRWPGGNFVSGYDWKDGIGDRDRRPPRRNPAWKGIEPNDVGIHEFIALCRHLDAEPLIVVNSGLGHVSSAVEEVAYVNGSSESSMGRLRAANGHPEPFQVDWWGIGNEMYGDWQLGHIPLEEYVEKHNRFAAAIQGESPNARLVAVGSVGDWSKEMLRVCADSMNLISEHFYVQDRENLAEHVALVPDRIRSIVEAHRNYRRELPSLVSKDIRISVDEYNYWYGGFIYGELGTRYFLRDALGIAAGIHEFVRNSDLVFMANYAQTVNVIGCIKTSKTEAEFSTTGLVLKLYRNHFGELPVPVQGQTGPLDLVAARTKDRSSLTIAVVNPTTEEKGLAVTLADANLSQEAERWVITGPDGMAFNEPGQPKQVDITREGVDLTSGEVRVPPISVVIYVLPITPVSR